MVFYAVFVVFLSQIQFENLVPSNWCDQVEEDPLGKRWWFAIQEWIFWVCVITYFVETLHLRDAILMGVVTDWHKRWFSIVIQTWKIIKPDPTRSHILLTYSLHMKTPLNHTFIILDIIHDSRVCLHPLLILYVRQLLKVVFAEDFLHFDEAAVASLKSFGKCCQDFLRIFSDLRKNDCWWCIARIDGSIHEIEVVHLRQRF